MRAIHLLAFLAVACFGTAATAQPVPPDPSQSPTTAQTNSSSEPISELVINAPALPTSSQHHDVDLVAKKSVKISATLKQVRATIGGVEQARPADSVTLAPVCGGKAEGSGFTVTPAIPCTLRATLTDNGRHGRYTARISLIGAAGDQKEFELGFARRRPIGWAVGLVLLGLVTGFLVMSWNSGGRDRSRAVIAIKEAIEMLLRLDALSGKPARMAEIVARARAMETALLRGAAADSVEVAELQARVSQYRFLLALETRGAKLSDDKQRDLQVPIRAAMEAMQPGSDGRLGAVSESLFAAAKAKLLELETPSAISPKSLTDSATPDLPLPITQDMSSASARFAFALAEWGVALVLMTIFAVVALGTVYVNNAYWGDYADLLAAYMIGFGAYAGSVASVTGFLQRARTLPS